MWEGVGRNREGIARMIGQARSGINLPPVGTAPPVRYAAANLNPPENP